MSKLRYCPLWSFSISGFAGDMVIAAASAASEEAALPAGIVLYDNIPPGKSRANIIAMGLSIVSSNGSYSVKVTLIIH